MAEERSNDTLARIRQELEELADPAYRTFQAKLVPTVDPRASLACARRPCARMPSACCSSGPVTLRRFSPLPRTRHTTR